MPYSQPPEMVSLRNNYNEARKDSISDELYVLFFLNYQKNSKILHPIVLLLFCYFLIFELEKKLLCENCTLIELFILQS